MQDNQIPGQNAGMPPYNIYYDRPRKRSSWWIPLLIIGIIVVLIIGFFAVVAGFIGSVFEKEQVIVKENSVLYVNLNNIEEYAPNTPLSLLGSRIGKASFIEALTAIKRAKDDDKIKGIFYSVKGELGLPSVKAEEFQKVLDEFKSSGKFIYSYIEMGSEKNYYNALPSDKIYMPEEGMLEMNGFSISSVFLKNAFDKIGMEYYVQQFEDFKSAGESFSKTKFSDSARYQLRVLLNKRNEDFIASVVKYRGIERAKVVAALNRGLYSSDSLQAYNFIDEIASEEQVKDMLKEKIFGRLDDSDKLNFISLNKYAASNDETPKEKVENRDKQIAIIYATGAITNQGGEGWSSEQSVRSDKFIGYLKKAREDSKVKAIIIRIDSPGGSVIASDAIYSEILKTRKVKPVYASMSDVAASGGYYIAMACDTIFAHPNTITGSIGVILMVNNFSKTLDKIGVTVDTILTSPAANFMSPLSPLQEKDKKYLFSISEKIYKRFVSKAAERRGKSFDEMRSLAKGRIWTGADAKKIGIIDVEGGLFDALDYAKQRIGVDKNKKVYLKTYPDKEESLMDLLKIFGIEEDGESSINIKSMAKAFGVSVTDFTAYWTLLPAELRSQVLYTYQLIEMANQENTLMAMPFYYDAK